MIKGFKGFSKDMTCQGHKFEVGKTYTHKGEIKLCEKGFHFCENPLDVLRYYSPTDSNFAEVEADKVSDEKSEDTKRVCSEIKIGAKITLSAVIQAGVSFLASACKSKKATSGDYSPSATSGENSISCAIGRRSTAKSTLGNWIVLSEIDSNHKVLCVKTAKVDGKKIKADTWYKLEGGKFVIAE